MSRESPFADVRRLADALDDAADALHVAKINFERFNSETTAGDVNTWIHEVVVARDRAKLIVAEYTTGNA